MEAIAYTSKYSRKNLAAAFNYAAQAPEGTASGGFRGIDGVQRVVDAVAGTDNPLRHLKHRGEYCEECPSHAKAKANRYCVECDELFCGRCFQLCHYVPPETEHNVMDFPFDPGLAANTRSKEGRGIEQWRGVRSGANASRLDVRLGQQAEDMGTNNLTLKAARSVVQLHEEHDRQQALTRAKSSKFQLPLNYAGAPPPPPKASTIVAEGHVEEKVNNQLPKRPPGVLYSPLDALARRSFGEPPKHPIAQRMQGVHATPVLRSGEFIGASSRAARFNPATGVSTVVPHGAGSGGIPMEIPDRFKSLTPLQAAHLANQPPDSQASVPSPSSKGARRYSSNSSRGKTLGTSTTEGKVDSDSRAGEGLSEGRAREGAIGTGGNAFPSVDFDISSIEEDPFSGSNTERGSQHSDALAATTPLHRTAYGDSPVRRGSGPLPLDKPWPDTHQLTHIDVQMGGRMTPPLQPHEHAVHHEYTGGFYVLHGRAAPGLASDPHAPYNPAEDSHTPVPNATIPPDVLHGPHAVLTSTYARPRDRTDDPEALDATLSAVTSMKHTAAPADLQRLKTHKPSSPGSPETGRTREYRSWRMKDEHLRRFVAGRYYGGSSLDITREYAKHSHPLFRVSQRVRFRSAEVRHSDKDLVVGYIVSTLDPAAERRAKEEAEMKALEEEGTGGEAALSPLERRRRRRQRHFEDMTPEAKRLTSVQRHARHGVHNVRYYKVKWEHVRYVPGEGNVKESHLELVPEDVLEAVDDHERRVITRCLRYMTQAHASKAFNRWVFFTEATREMATYNDAARTIQRCGRYFLRRLVEYEQEEEEERLRQQAERKEQLRRAALEREERIREESRKYRHLGYSIDGVRYFRTYADMMKAVEERERKARAMATAFEPVLSNLLKHAVQQWRGVVDHVRPFETLTASHVQNMAENEAEAEAIREELTREMQYMQAVREERETADAEALLQVTSQTQEIPDTESEEEEEEEEEEEQGKEGEEKADAPANAARYSAGGAMTGIVGTEHAVPVDVTPGATPRDDGGSVAGDTKATTLSTGRTAGSSGSGPSSSRPDTSDSRPVSRARRVKPELWETWSDDEADPDEPGEGLVKRVGKKKRRVRAAARTILSPAALAAIDAGNVVDRRMQSQLLAEDAAGEAKEEEAAPAAQRRRKGKDSGTGAGQGSSMTLQAQGSVSSDMTEAVLAEARRSVTFGGVEVEGEEGSTLEEASLPSAVMSLAPSASIESERLLPNWRGIKHASVRAEDSIHRELNDLSSVSVGLEGSDDQPMRVYPQLHGAVFEGFSTEGSTVTEEGSKEEAPKDATTLRAEETALRLAQERREKRTQPEPWHPALGAQLPTLPQLGVTQLHDSSVRVEQSNKFASFRAYCRGSFDASNWLIKGCLQIGPYPQGQAVYDDPAITQRSSTVAKLLLDGVCTYVNLMSEAETASLITDYQQELMMKAREIRTIYVRREKALKSTYEARKNVFEKSENYAPERRKAFEKQYIDAKKEYEAAKRVTDAFPSKLNHIMYPLPADSLASDRTVLALVKHLEGRIRAGESIYVFSKLGRGRAAVVGGAVLGRMYGLSAEAALKFVQAGAGVRQRYVVPPIRARPMLPDPEAKGRGNKAKKAAVGDDIFAQAIAAAAAAEAGASASAEAKEADKQAKRRTTAKPVYQARRFDLQKYIREGKGKVQKKKPPRPQEDASSSILTSSSSIPSAAGIAASSSTASDASEQASSADCGGSSDKKGSVAPASAATGPITGVAAPPPKDTSGFGFHIPKRKRVFRPTVHPPIRSVSMPSPTEWMPCPVTAAHKQQLRRLVVTIDPAHTAIVNAAAEGGTYWAIDKPRGQGVPPISPISFGVTIRPDNP